MRRWNSAGNGSIFEAVRVARPKDLQRLELHDELLDLEGHLADVAVGPTEPVRQAIQPAILVAGEDLAIAYDRAIAVTSVDRRIHGKYHDLHGNAALPAGPRRRLLRAR